MPVEASVTEVWIKRVLDRLVGRQPAELRRQSQETLGEKIPFAHKAKFMTDRDGLGLAARQGPPRTKVALPMWSPKAETARVLRGPRSVSLVSAARLSRTAKAALHHLQILPGGFFQIRVIEQELGVIGNCHLYTGQLPAATAVRV